MGINLVKNYAMAVVIKILRLMQSMDIVVIEDSLPGTGRRHCRVLQYFSIFQVK